MWPPRPDQKTDLPVPYAPGSRSGTNVQAGGLIAAGLAMDTTVQATNTALATTNTELSTVNSQLVTGVPPAVANYAVHSLLNQAPTGGPFTVYTFTGAGRIWKASVTLSVGSSTGTGVIQCYARVLVSGSPDLAIVNGAVVGSPAWASATASQVHDGLAVPNSTVIQLDVNNAVVPTGALVQASCLIGVSIP